MRKRIYLHLFLVGVVCIVATALICVFAFWQTTRQQILQDLSLTLSVLSEEGTTSSHPETVWEATGKAMPTLRITWVDPNGNVTYDSWEAPSHLGNHNDRPEIRMARQNGEGSYLRQSATLGEITLYAAKRLPDGTVLRLSRTQKDLLQPLKSLLPWWILALGLLMFICQWTVRRMTTGILQPLENATAYLSQVGSGIAQEDAIAQAGYPELRPFLTTIARQGAQLDHSFQELEQECNTMKSITDNLQEGVLLLDKQLRIQWINTWGYTLLVKERRNLLDSRHSLLGQFLLPLLPAESLPNADALRTEETLHWFMEKDGRQFALYLQPLTPPQQRAPRLLLILDVTESRQREKLRQDFTANVTHELKTPLTSISGFAELMAAGMVQKKEDIAHFGQLIRQESRRLLAMINSILLLSKIEGAPKKSLHKPVRLDQIAASVVEFLQPLCEQKQVTVHAKFSPVTIQGNDGLLREMVISLLDNAVKYNKPQGQVNLTVETRKGRAVLTVQDTGIGIPERARQRIFERFYRAESSRSKESGGTGLGLSIVKHIVELHDGDIHLASQEGQGTVFTLTFPLAVAPTQSSQ